MATKEMVSTALFTKYPIKNILVYNGITISHYILGGIGIILGYDFTELAYLFGALYLLFAFGQMYVLMPLMVCPNCVYYRLNNSRCTTALNIFSKKIIKEGSADNFPNRAKGLFCHNNMYMAALLIPIVAMIPALVVNFSLSLLTIFFGVIGLLFFRIFVVFQKIACVHCRAMNVCPNAQAMGLTSK
ncbi:MAG: hypothetical protein ACFFDT_05425 [Candidatus Hodarchaeota archaeon]